MRNSRLIFFNSGGIPWFLLGQTRFYTRPASPDQCSFSKCTYAGQTVPLTNMFDPQNPVRLSMWSQSLPKNGTMNTCTCKFIREYLVNNVSKRLQISHSMETLSSMLCKKLHHDDVSAPRSRKLGAVWVPASRGIGSGDDHARTRYKATVSSVKTPLD